MSFNVCYRDTDFFFAAIVSLFVLYHVLVNVSCIC